MQQIFDLPDTSCQAYINYSALGTFEGGKVAFTKAPQDNSGPKRNNDRNCGNLHWLKFPRHFLSFNLRLGSVFISGRQNSNLSNLSTWPFSNMSICAKSLWPWHQPCTYFGDIWLSHYLDWIENNQNQQTSHKQSCVTHQDDQTNHTCLYITASP